MRTTTTTILFIATSSMALAYDSNDFANEVVSATSLKAPAPYNNPASILGAPTSWVKDSMEGDPKNNHEIAVSLPYAPWNVDLNGNPVEAKIQSGESVTVKFDNPITHSADHWYGDDFIVYTNPFFVASSSSLINYKTDMSNVKLLGLYSHPISVSVSEDDIHWYTYAPPSKSNLFPTEAYEWDATDKTWGEAMDYTKPIDPSLTTSSLFGLTAAQAIADYNGSAGGTAFSLEGTGLSEISYIRFSGLSSDYSVIDAVARVGNDPAAIIHPSVPSPAGATVMLLFGLVAKLRRRRSSR